MNKTMSNKKRYAMSGLSRRGFYGYLLPLLGKASSSGANDFSCEAEVVAIVDPDIARVERICSEMGVQIPIYLPEDFSRMLSERNPDTVIVMGPDFTHHDYIVESLRTGRDAITEKPMVISSEQARSVLTAERESGRRVYTTHNLRCSPLIQTAKTLLMENRIGRVTNIEFAYNIDTSHGSSYFFRWNRERAKSGGLNVHKCCHHFDLINWLLDDHPETLSAFGRRNYYGPEGALRPRDASGEPLDPIETKQQCPYFQNHYAAHFPADSNKIGIGWDSYKSFYDYQYPPTKPRYIYDEAIDIEDTYGALIEYRRGAIVSYSCNFSAPWAGYNLGINGTGGRIEIAYRAITDPTGLSATIPPKREITFYPLFGKKEVIEVPSVAGGHGGADPIMERNIFGQPSEDSKRLGLIATSYQAALAVAQGEAVYRSLSTRQMIEMRDLLGEHYCAEG